MRKFILGLCLFSNAAFANQDVLLSNGLHIGTELQLVSDIPFGSGAGVFYVVDTDNSWRRNSKPDHDQTYCAFFSREINDEVKTAKAGEVYQVVSNNSFHVVGGVGTKIELAKLDSNKQVVPSHLNFVICTHSHIEHTKNLPRIRTVLRYELYVDEFRKLLSPYLTVR